MNDLVRAHVLISGRVQGVFFRASTKDEARARGLTGWVRNLPGGAVEAVFEGPRETVEAMILWCHEGSQLAAVREVKVEWQEPGENFPDFSVRG
ncbi:MAG: acylphosphatase [Pseudomonadota bacterium]